jgi:hypothetical protein
MTPFLPLAELERRCQKPDHRRVGNWMARHVARPAALRITRVVIPTGVTAHQATLVAWGVAMAAAVAFGVGTPASWLVGAALWQLWYLLDHVDGQLARYHRTVSLDGTQLDYLMHHVVNLVIPASLGFGLLAATSSRAALLAGFVWGVALLVLGLGHDARYKAFTHRLKRLRGELRVIGGGGARPQPTSPPPRTPTRLAAYLARKGCETHVVMNVLSLLAVAQFVLGDDQLVLGSGYVLSMALVGVVLFTALLLRSLKRHSAEVEFATWYRPPEGATLEFEEGWWTVRAATAGDDDDCRHCNASSLGSS